MSRKRGRPLKRNADPFFKMIRVGKDLYDLLLLEKRGSETFNETALRLIREKRQELIAIKQQFGMM